MSNTQYLRLISVIKRKKSCFLVETVEIHIRDGGKKPLSHVK